MTLDYTGNVTDIGAARQRRTRTFAEIDGVPVLATKQTTSYYPLGHPFNDDPRQPLLQYKFDVICDDDWEEHTFCVTGGWSSFPNEPVCEEAWLKRGTLFRIGNCLCHQAEEETGAEN